MPIPSATFPGPVPLIGYGDVEQTVLSHLRRGLLEFDYAGVDAVAFGTRYPDPPVDVFVLARRVGGVGPRFGVDLARLDVQVWHRSDVEAHDLAALVRALLHTARGVGSIRGVRETAGPVPIPDPDTGRSRYLLTVDLTLRGALL